MYFCDAVYRVSFHMIIKLFSKRKILDFSKLKEFANDNSDLGKNDGKFSKQIENAMGKEKLFLFPETLLKTYIADT